MTPGPPDPLDRRVVHDGRIVRLSVDTVRFPDGSTGEMELVRHPGAAGVLPLLGRPGDDAPDVLLLRQFRYAAGGELWEIPAGIPRDPEEPWEECARRELEEETGWRAGSLRGLTRVHTSPGFCDEVVHLYLAWDLERGREDLDADEFVEVVTVGFGEALAMVREGTVTDAKTVAALLYASSFVLGRSGVSHEAPGSSPREDNGGG